MPNGSPYIIDIAPGMDATAFALSGPKVSRLSELQQLGLDVPRGFAVTTTAFQYALAQSGAEAKLRELEEASRGCSAQELPALAAQMRGLVEAVAVPADLDDGIGQALASLETELAKDVLRLAVRSSATGEDAADKSFAGQYESYLGVTGKSDLIGAVRDCWASLFNDRAVDYRNRAGRSFVNSPMAVGVVELIDARAAGVAFSVDPVTGHRDRLVIEATWGFGEALVQGLISPDRFRIDKEEARIIQKEIGDKSQISLFDPKTSRVIESAMADEKRTVLSIEDELAVRIGTTVRSLEANVGAPVDVEWVVEQRAGAEPRLVFVQMRPISTLADEPELPRWQADMIAQTWR
ncbi:PEP/pyruvate-binding domain-containing protein [Leisingera sp. ANG59]|uniref:PEP/pyruvate-binding domain-containing protein n=1 Tax=Leisingera sp. ANG59 TaxID=2675221 RepID=UPI0015731702|nr:PEP/pyruvate-binding domain-containing protein [Leisingera sp. ANG59]NSY40631.1 pyruvate kinase [Leisingera sp. ANG59]